MALRRRAVALSRFRLDERINQLCTTVQALLDRVHDDLVVLGVCANVGLNGTEKGHQCGVLEGDHELGVDKNLKDGNEDVLEDRDGVEDLVGRDREDPDDVDRGGGGPEDLDEANLCDESLA